MHKDPTLMSGFTDNYIKIDAPFEANRINTICTVRLKQVTRSGNMAAEILYDGQPLPYLAV
jgi:hypothetical protein